MLAVSLDTEHLPYGLWGDSKSCRALLLHLDNGKNNTNKALSVVRGPGLLQEGFGGLIRTCVIKVGTRWEGLVQVAAVTMTGLGRLLETAGLRKQPETRVVVVGERRDVEEVLLHHSLGNTIHALYLAVHSNTPIIPLHRLRLDTKLHYFEDELREKQEVLVYRRCLYCNYGKAGVQYMRYSKLTSPASTYHVNELNLFNEKDQLYNFDGHQLKFIAALYFPYIEFEANSDQPLTPVIPKDSLDVRLADTFSEKLNFTSGPRKFPKRVKCEILLEDVENFEKKGDVIIGIVAPTFKQELVSEASKSRGSFNSNIIEKRHIEAAEQLMADPDTTIRRVDKASTYVLIITEEYS
ncbi:hypothetical protein Pmani_013243 [Petrolisthes manimaculis]|uniref:Uncharacterized protein n=1 Tax=Petrolisthes manimaculis TaxID=1843537 RepID=A0AAE1PZ97_9EUCA|nr:hypothetical protein Pmani_013243 [Petrolisthes manimaculis]